MAKKNIEYFEKQNDVLATRVREAQAEYDRTIEEIDQVEKKLEECLSAGDLVAYKDQNKKRSELKDVAQSLAAYLKKITDPTYKIYSMEELKEAWKEVCLELNQKTKGKYESLMKAKAKYQAEAQEFVKVDREGENVLSKWMGLVPEEIRKQHNRGSANTYLSGLADYDYADINWINLEQ